MEPEVRTNPHVPVMSGWVSRASGHEVYGGRGNDFEAGLDNAFTPLALTCQIHVQGRSIVRIHTLEHGNRCQEEPIGAQVFPHVFQYGRHANRVYVLKHLPGGNEVKLKFAPVLQDLNGLSDVGRE